MNWLKFFKKENKKTIGRLEYINIPELNLYNISAKIDTGAYRGAIHATNIKEIVDENGNKKLQFNVLDEEHPESDNVIHSTDDYKTSKFRGTKTDLHERYVITVNVEIAEEVIEAELSLTDRKDLRHPILIGRRALKKKFLVDVNKKYD